MYCDVINVQPRFHFSDEIGDCGHKQTIWFTWSAVPHFLVTCSAGPDSCSFLVFGPAAALTVQLKHAFKSTATRGYVIIQTSGSVDYVLAGPVISALNHPQTIGYFLWRVPHRGPKNRNMGDNSHHVHSKHGRGRLGMILSSS